MEPHDLYIRLGGDRPASGGRTRVEFRLPFDEVERSEEITLPALPDRMPATLSAAGRTLASDLAAVITQASLTAGQPFSPLAGLPFLPILLDIQESALYGLDWESLLQPPLFPASEVTRYRPLADERVLTPFQLPAGLLLATAFPEPPGVGPTDNATRYFRSVSAVGASARDVYRLLATGSFEIAHLRVRAEWSDRQTGVLFLNGPDEALMERALFRALTAGRTRLLVLECRDQASFPPLIDLAHRLLARGGPTVVAIETATRSSLFDDFYMDIVHDTALDDALRNRRPLAARAALFLSAGGADVLRISPIAERLTIEAQARAQDAQEVAAVLREQTTLASPPRVNAIKANLDAAEDSFHRLEESRKTAYDYQHESGAWQPIGAAQRAGDSAARTLRNVRRRTDRVVNAWFTREAHPLKRTEVLEPGAAYTFAVQIGPRSEHSVVRGPAAIPEHELERFYTDEGLVLRVVLFSRDFQLERTAAPLRLPRPPRESPTLEFPLRAPTAAGTARLRVCIYYEQNLLQSLLVRARIGRERAWRPRRAGRGLDAEVEFALSGTLREPGSLPPRLLNILLNEGDNGSHTFAVVGKNLREQFDFSEGAVRGPVGDARRELQNICADTRDGQMKYRFDNRNRGSEQQFIDNLRTLAELGYELYVKLVTAQDAPFEQHLHTALGASGARIQIAAVKSAQYVFPWALVYDHPIVKGMAKPCPQFLADVRHGGQQDFLLAQRCLTRGCPHADDSAVVCPSGFWGFKHVVEQPLSVHKSKRNGASGDASRDLVASIDVARPATFLMAVSRRLSEVAEHQREVERNRDLAVSLCDTKLAVGAGLQGRNAGLVYFYCHGGRSGSRTWLGIGKNEELVAADLFAWKVQWPVLHPLVFINGCHTVDITPDDLLGFTDMLRWCRAAGVIGTEISIPETLGREFGGGFVRRFIGGRNVGDAMREQRLSLLERHNLLGLAYTPYCWANLELKFV